MKTYGQVHIVLGLAKGGQLFGFISEKLIVYWGLIQLHPCGHLVFERTVLDVVEEAMLHGVLEDG